MSGSSGRSRSTRRRSRRSRSARSATSTARSCTTCARRSARRRGCASSAIAPPRAGGTPAAGACDDFATSRAESSPCRASTGAGDILAGASSNGPAPPPLRPQARRALRRGRRRGGSGPLAGPLVVAGVLLDYASLRDHRVRPLADLNDSKQCSPEQRERLFRAVLGSLQRAVVRVIPPTDIDRNGLHRSNLEGMRRVPPRALAAGRGLPRRRVPSRAERAGAHGGGRRRREERRDRRRLDPREGDARPAHAARRRALPALRLLLARRLHHAAHSAVVRRIGPSEIHRRSWNALCYADAAGSSAERRAAWHYRLRGYRILERNAWAGRNELDLVARRGRRLVFVEVKEKTGPGSGIRPRWSAGEAASPPPRGRTWLALNPDHAGLEARFDVIAVSRGRVRRIEDAFWTRPPAGERGVMAPSQDALYGEIDLELSWSERELPQRERTRHVHGLHPYLGKFVPSSSRRSSTATSAGSARARSLRRVGNDARPGARERPRRDRRRHRRVQLPAHARQDAALQPLLARSATCATAAIRRCRARRRRGAGEAFLRTWYAPQAAADLKAFRALLDDYEHAHVLRVVLARAARSARLTTHFDLDFPQAPQRAPTGATSTRECASLLRSRGTSSSGMPSTRSSGSRRSPACGRAAARRSSSTATRVLDFGGRLDGVITSPPLPGPDRLPRAAPVRLRAARPGSAPRALEVGAAAGTSRAALAAIPSRWPTPWRTPRHSAPAARRS